MPCSGKSTIAKACAKSLGYTYISSGDIARDIAAQNKSMVQSLNNGNMANEELMRTRIYYKFMLLHDKSIILDGFPRFIDQDHWLHNLYITNDVQFKYIYVPISRNEAISRATKRDRPDDHSIESRIQYYINNTAPILNLHLYDVVDQETDINIMINNAMSILK